jgi:hypothetical protein
MEAGTEWNAFLEAINALGVIGLLTFMVLAFYRGDLVARNLLDRILALYEDKLSELTERILDRLDQQVPKQN